MSLHSLLKLWPNAFATVTTKTSRFPWSLRSISQRQRRTRMSQAQAEERRNVGQDAQS